MIRKQSLLQTIAACSFLTLLALAGSLPARTPEPASSAGQAAGSPSVAEAQGDTHVLLYQKLVAVNENWLNHTPDFEILALAGSIEGEVSLIQTHLKLVIGLLRDADIEHLSDSQLVQRSAHLQTLQQYMADGNFPQNVFGAGRRPVFIDPWGTHCAVGHLIATSGHPELATTINRQHRLDLLRDIKTEGLSQWQQASGLSIDELALIQPTYRSTTLNYPNEIEDLILGNSEAITAGIESGERSVDARCGGKTLLHYAAAAGDLELVKLLVAKGADLHAISSLGCDKGEFAKGGNQTLVTVRWNQSTSVSNRGGFGMGRRGSVFKTPRGQFVAGILNDLHGGQAGLNALDYATAAPSSYGFSPRRYINPIRPPYGIKVELRKEDREDEIITVFKKDRAAVAAWLKEQGLEAKS